MRVQRMLIVVVFPAPFGAEEAEYLTLLHLKAYIIHRNQVAKLLYYVLHLYNFLHLQPF